MKPIKPLDAAWLYVDTRETPMQVGCLAIFSLPPKAGPAFLKKQVETFRSTREFVYPFNLRLKAPRLRFLLPAWEEDRQIDLDYHFRHSALPQPGGERELGILVSRLHSNAMDFNRPLWECHLIEGLQHRRFALYMKMHHSLVDGISGMRMLARILSPDPNSRTQLPPWAVGARQKTKTREPLASPWQAALDGMRVQLKTVPGVTRAFGDIVREAVRQEEKDWALPFSGPRSAFNGKISGQRRFATQHYSLARVRRIAKAADVTVNDVFLEICAGSMRRYLGEMHALPSKPLTAGVPVSVRPADDQSAGNAISFIIANLNTNIADPLQRLRAIHDSAQAAKLHLQQLPKADMDNYTALFMAPFMAQLLSGLGGHLRPMFNLTVSNVPGPDQTLYFNGARMEQMYPVSLLAHGQALNITAVSYAGQFNVGFTGCREALPSMQRLSVYAGEALDELEQVLGIGAPAETATAD
ncbi:WS/DGAT/MGAT family O-acyltransferase [Solimonas marina]|uniref:diacylglycerol O-acyltransferase n=1 Tax=Solimonas marina TaxID=2714601 RepID=A0A969W6X8_9GAMM|nr:wax ester/triacylglycerol synthase family O-acyltransferase [Solimonas marina]NKF20725.1 wax ester/triacylglycerol synthase family O-acyltransferase [Solimonas marina]